MEKDLMKKEKKEPMKGKKNTQKLLLLAKKKKALKGNIQVLSYPIPLRCKEEDRIVKLLQISQKVANNRLKKGYNKECLDELMKSKKRAYKVLEPMIKVKAIRKLPSRIHRGVLEMTGRTLRSVNVRRNLFQELLKLSDEPKKWDYRKLIEEKGIYAKSQYVKNIAEQTENFQKKHGRLPNDFLELQPKLRQQKAIISYAPDDGQAIRLKPEGKNVHIRLKVPSLEEETDLKQSWEFIEFKIPLPTFLQNQPISAPDLRLANIHGKLVPVLDYKIQCSIPNKEKSEYFLTVDWATRKLVTVCVFNYEGEQVSPPIFLHFKPILSKLLRIRSEIDDLKKKRAQFPRKSSSWKKHNREIAKRWRKFRAINKSLSHLAANIIVIIAQIYNCSTIHVEWLKGFKSKKNSKLLNWILNSTVREAIYSRVKYKADLAGITLAKPTPPAGTSQYCPHCGHKGIHTKSPDNHTPNKKGGWFRCQNCEFNCDRDYAACCNLARKVLYGNGLKNQRKGIVYKKVPISDSLSRQRNDLIGRLLYNLNGWKDSVFLRPRKLFFSGTLRV